VFSSIFMSFQERARAYNDSGSNWGFRGQLTPFDPFSQSPKEISRTPFGEFGIFGEFKTSIPPSARPRFDRAEGFIRGVWSELSMNRCQRGGLGQVRGEPGRRCGSMVPVLSRSTP